MKYLAVVVMLLGCSAAPPSSLTIWVRTDLLLGEEVDTVRTELSDSRGETPTHASISSPSSADLVRVAVFDPVDRGDIYARVQLMRDEVVLLERVALVDVDGATILTLLMTRNCTGVVCPESNPALTACLDAQCVDPRCTQETPQYCPEPTCSDSDDCGARSDCTSGVCEDGVCFQRPRDGACAASSRCDIDRGCRPNAPAECMSRLDCERPVDCMSVSCIGGECVESVDPSFCEAAQRCEPTFGCVQVREPECVVAADCAAAPACVRVGCETGMCTAMPDDSLCPAGQECGQAVGCQVTTTEPCRHSPESCGGLLGAICESTDDCVEGECCTNESCAGMCTLECETDSACPEHMGCSEAERCMFTCDDLSQCADGQLCFEGLCVWSSRF